MLYHWYELDLEAEAPVEASRHKPARVDTPVIRYNAIAAVAHANGAPHWLNTSKLALKAANDRNPDTIAIRLRKVGLGVIGLDQQRAQPGDYAVMRQTAKLCQSTFSFITACALIAVRLCTQRRSQRVTAFSHTMVSNGADDHVTARDDAQRQRCDVSIG